MVEVELSLVHRDILTNGVAETCAKHGIPICAYFPFGAGILTGHIAKEASLSKGDIRKKLQCFDDKNLEATQDTVRKLQAFAAEKKMTTAQLLLTWIRSISARPGMPVIIPIPGAQAVERVQQNTELKPLFNDEEMDALDELMKGAEIHGGFEIRH